MRNFIQEPPGLTAGEGGSTRHPDSFSPCQGWFQSVTPRGSGSSCLSSPWHLSLFRLPLASSPPFPWSLVGTLCAPLLSPHPSDVSLFGLSRSEMSLELFCSKDSCEDLTSHSEAHVQNRTHFLHNLVCSPAAGSLTGLLPIPMAPPAWGWLSGESLSSPGPGTNRSCLLAEQHLGRGAQ